jgi:MSHA biogenesis protein MshI
MSLTPSAARTSRRPWRRAARAGWCGVYSAGPERLVAAVSYAGTAERPAVQVAPVFDGTQAAAALAQWQRAAHRGARANVLLNSVDYRIVPIEPPAVPPVEMRAALRWHLQGLVDLPLEDAGIDLMQVPGPTPDAPSRQIFAVAARAQPLREWMQRCRDLRLTLGAVDIPELAMRNLSVLAAGTQAHAFVHLGLKSTRLVLVWQRELCAFRQFDVAAYKLDAADEDTRALLIERLALEIQRSTDSFSRQFHGADLRTVWVSAVREADRISQQLSQLLPQQVHAFRVEDHVALDSREPVVDADRGLDFTFPIGAALRPLEH